MPQSSADPPFLSKTFNANAKEGNAKAKKGETTGKGNSKKDYELHYLWNHRGAGPRHTKC
jgi:hypothetical protein